MCITAQGTPGFARTRDTVDSTYSQGKGLCDERRLKGTIGK